MGPPTQRQRERDEDQVTLRDYMDERITTLQKAIMERFDQRDRELERLERGISDRLRDFTANVDRRFQEVNAYKEGTRHLVEQIKEALEQRLRMLEQHKANMEGRFLIFAGVWGVVIVLINFALRRVLG